MNHVKHVFAAAVVIADVLFGMAAPEAVKNLHHESRAHLYWAVGVYAALAVLTLWVVASVIRGISERKAPAPAPRPASGYPFTRIGGPR